jgi:hypothetical protein
MVTKGPGSSETPNMDFTIQNDRDELRHVELKV